MRPFWSALAMLSILAACGGPNPQIEPVEVYWMEWPSEVDSGQGFDVRLLIEYPCVAQAQLVAAPTADNSALTFAPFFVVLHPLICPDLPSAAVANSAIAYGYAKDTTVLAPGLGAAYPRTFEVRGAANVTVAQAASALPVRTFGEITVRPDSAMATRTNVGGEVLAAYRDSLGCLRVRPFGILATPGYLVENPDTALTGGAFVRGYLYSPATPLCGEHRVFHLVSLN